MKVKCFMFIGLFICTLINPAAAFASTGSAYPNQNSSSSTFNQFLFFILGDKASSKKEWDHAGNSKEWDYDFDKKKCDDQESNDIWRRFYHDWGKNRDKDWGHCDWGNNWHDDEDCDEGGDITEVIKTIIGGIMAIKIGTKTRIKTRIGRITVKRTVIAGENGIGFNGRGKAGRSQ